MDLFTVRHPTDTLNRVELISGWRPLQQLLAARNARQPFLRLGAGQTIDIVFVGDPVGVRLSNSPQHGYTVCSSPDDATVNMHVLINVFVPDLATTKVLAGDFTLYRRLIREYFLYDLYHWVYSIRLDAAGHHAMEPGDTIDDDRRGQIIQCGSYDLDEQLVQLYCDQLNKERSRS